MLRIVVCSAALIAVMAGLKYLLNASFEAWGYWPYMAICAVGGCAFIVFAWLYDRANSHRQEVLPPERRDFR
jgi:hypothetical protein